MSVGGTVIETMILPDRVWINTKEKPHYHSECAIYVELSNEAKSVSEGDSVWWQGAFAYWTPRTGSFKNNVPFADKKLKRIGFSGISRESAMKHLKGDK